MEAFPILPYRVKISLFMWKKCENPYIYYKSCEICDSATIFCTDACHEILTRITYGGTPNYALQGQNFTFYVKKKCENPYILLQKLGNLW